MGELDKSVELVSQNKSFGGWHRQYRHVSTSNQCDMRFAIFVPPQADEQSIPVLYWLSGLTCSDENFMQKAGAHRIAAELGMAIVAPDTSPRGEGVADDPDGSYDLGLGAGFYVNATQDPWRSHYQMYDYIAHELPALIQQNFSVTDDKAIAGHSMGGHGALTIGIRNPEAYRSISAFSPICHPTQSPWGIKALTAYLGNDKSNWSAHDAVLLLQQKPSGLPPIRVEQGMADEFLEQQLQLEALERVIEQQQLNIEVNHRPDYDHSYYFIASFIEQHCRFHATHLGL